MLPFFLFGHCLWRTPHATGHLNDANEDGHWPILIHSYCLAYARVLSIPKPKQILERVRRMSDNEAPDTGFCVCAMCLFFQSTTPGF